MDFIMENYLWFGIAGVVLLMALIGFLAEKTNFITNGSSRLKKDKKNKKGKKDSNEPIVEDMSFAPDETITSKDDITIDSNDEEPVNDIENIPAEILDVPSSDNIEPTIGSAPIQNTTWTNVEEPVKTEEPVSIVTENGEDLSVPLTSETPVTNIDTNVTDEVMTSNEPAVEEDEDIWKF